MVASSRSRPGSCVLFAVAAVGLVAATATAQGIIDPVVLTGDLAPDGSGAFFSIGGAKLNDAGQVAFSAGIGTHFDDYGLFRAEIGTPLVQIARTGPFAANSKFVGDVAFSDLNNAGQVVFEADAAAITFPSRSYHGIFLGDGGAITRVARSGDPLSTIPGFANATLSNVPPTFPSFLEGLTTLDDLGRVSFWGNVDACELVFDGCTPVNFDAVIRAYANGTLHLINRTGSPAPVAGGGTSGTFDECVGPALAYLPSILTSNSGDMVFRVTTTSPSSEGLFWSNAVFPQVTRAVARNGQTLIPGAAGTILVATNEAPPGIRAGVDLNDAGEVAFWADLNHPLGDRGIYRWSPDEASIPGAHGLTEIARSGEASPDGNGTLDGIFFYDVQLNEQGQVAFLALIDNGGDVDEGVFRGDGQTLTLIAREDQLTPDGQRRFGAFFSSAINDDGLVAFRAGLRDLNGQSVPGTGVYISDGVHLVEVMRPGQPLAGSIATNVILAEGDAINALGQVAFSAGLEDGRDGIFLFLPEPGTALMLVAGGILLAVLRSRA